MIVIDFFVSYHFSLVFALALTASEIIVGALENPPPTMDENDRAEAEKIVSGIRSAERFFYYLFLLFFIIQIIRTLWVMPNLTGQSLPNSWDFVPYIANFLLLRREVRPLVALVISIIAYFSYGSLSVVLFVFLQDSLF